MRPLLLLLFAVPVFAADLPPDKGSTIPESGKRPVVISGKSSLPLPKHDLPEGYTLEVAAASPLVTHPIMGCLDDKGRLFVGDAVGVNWNKPQLEANPPNRVLLLEDTDQDGSFDKSTVFADKMTFPQGACWLNGSLYVGSPPGIWTCKPDGTDIAWHSLGCGDNPVEVDFTRDGDIIGVQNLYYTQPRGDTIIHWLYGGVYERSDQLKAIAHLPRTLETMPVMYNFGHVAVSGCAFWKNYPTENREPRTEQFMVTHFNTQRLVRMELTPSGSTYKAVENEFLRLHNPDIHLTDVMEDPRDGSLLLLDTGGWFRIGCPASLMAKSDLLGAVYRIKPKVPVKPIAQTSKSAPTNLKSQIANLESSDAQVRRHALEWINANVKEGHEDKKEVEAVSAALREMMHEKIDPPIEHSLITIARNLYVILYHDVKEASDDTTLRHMLQCFQPEDGASTYGIRAIAAKHLDSQDEALALVALKVCTESPSEADESFAPDLSKWLSEPKLTSQRIKALSRFCTTLIDKPKTQSLVTAMLGHTSAEVSKVALTILATQTTGTTNDAWLPALDKLLAESPTPLVFDAIKKLKTPHFDASLQAIANDTKRPLAIRLKALDSAKSVKLTGETFTMVKGVLTDSTSSAAAKIQAAGMIASAPMPKPQLLEVAPLFATLGPVELKSLLGIVRKSKEPEVGRTFATEIAKNPVIASQQESLYRTAFSDLPPDIFETIILPAYNAAVAASEAKKRQLGPLADKVIATGNAANGKKGFEMGKGTCIACHKIGSAGRPIGPDLSHIGAIRTERDLLESILFPSNTLARDYEAHVIETTDGQQTLGVIKSHTAEGLLVIDIAGQEKTIAHQTIAGDTTLPTSLMPQGLDQTMPESDLLDLVAWLRTLK